MDSDSAVTARLCVATYQEAGVMEWIDNTGMDACIYNVPAANGRRPIWHDRMIPLRNVAREASQYLHHIVENYGNFRDYELFLQGDPFAHAPQILLKLTNRKWEGMAALQLGSLMHFDPNFSGLFSDQVLPFARDIGMKDSEMGPWTVGAMFAASRHSLESRPLEWWELLQKKVSAARSFSPWVMEQLWLAILNAPYRPHKAITS